jgi:hypothetical protein
LTPPTERFTILEKYLHADFSGMLKLQNLDMLLKDLLCWHLIRPVKVSVCNISIPGKTNRYMVRLANMTTLAGQRYRLVQGPRNLKFGTAFDGLIIF